MPIDKKMPEFKLPERDMSVRDAVFSENEEIAVSDSVGRTLSSVTVGCPPAVPIIVSGEKINEDIIKCFKYYGVDKCLVVKG